MTTQARGRKDWVMSCIILMFIFIVSGGIFWILDNVPLSLDEDIFLLIFYISIIAFIISGILTCLTCRKL